MAEGDGYQEVLRWLETAVLENSEVRQWQEDNMQTAQQIAQREKALYRSRFLYDSVYGSLLECESVWKGFYNMMGLEYRDTDSEDEDSVRKRQTNAIKIIDVDMDDDDVEEDHHHENENENLMDCDVADASLAAVKMEQSMMEDSFEAMEESCPSLKREAELQKQSMNSADNIPAHSLQASVHGMPTPRAPVSARSTPMASPAHGRSASPLLTPSPSSLTQADANLITSKLKKILSKSDVPTGPKTGKTNKASTPSVNNITPTASPTSAAVNSTPEGSRKTASKSTARKQTSIRKFTQVQPKASPREPNRISVPENASPKSSGEKHKQDATKQQTLALTTAKVSNSKSDLKNLPASKTPTAVCASTRSQSSFSVGTNLKVNTLSETPAPTHDQNSRHTPSPNSSASGKLVRTSRANTSSTVSKSQKSTSRPSTPDDQQQLMQNSTNSTQQSNQRRATYKPKTVSEVWGSDCEDSSEDEATSPSSTISKSQKSASQSSKCTNQNLQAPPPQTTANSAQQATQQGTTLQPRPVTQSWRRGAISVVNKAPEPVKELKVNMTVMARQRTKTWKAGTLTEIRPVDGGLKYEVNFESKKMLLSGHHIAFSTPPVLVQLKVGSRVAARFHEGNQSWVMSAIIMELPDRKNRMRFLVFYDDGNVGYVMLPDMHLVYKPLENVWEDIEDPEVRKVVQEFLQKNNKSGVIVLRQGEQLKVQHNGEWKDATITEVDSSLVKVIFMEDQHTEWLYKGSERLIYVYKIKQCPPEERNSGTGSTVRPPVCKSQTTSTAAASSSSRATASTSTSKAVTSQQTSTLAVSKTVAHRTITIHDVPVRKLQPKVLLKKMSVSEINSAISSRLRALSPVSVSPPSPPNAVAVPPQRGMKRPLSSPALNSPVVLSYNPHRCCPACLDPYRPSQPNPHLGHNPLQIPRHHGFHRITGRRRIDGKVSFHVFYRSPCGRSLSTMKQVQDFLFQTRCDFLSLDMYSLDPFVLVNRATPPGQPPVFFSLPDISNGAETVPIPCLNQIDDARPELIQYITKRRPGTGVYINTQTDFLVGCDCTDGCLDRAKCSCHQLTVEATALCPGGPVDEGAGYTYKRLLAPLITGVYECNPLCRCDPRMCSNRVVQHGPQLRLEMFKTQHKGWGIRCLDDINKGTFVCTFAGKIVTDELANAQGKVSGDEYFANLDYIEGVEKEKEGYESAVEFSDSEDGSKEPTKPPHPSPATDRSTDDSYSDDENDEDYNDSDCDDTLSEDGVSSDASFVADEKGITLQRSYITRRNAKMLKVSPSEVKNLGESGPRSGFAVKSSYQKVKSTDKTTKPSNKNLPSRNATRRLFDGEKNCYIIDALHQGNLGRYINHSCDPNLFVQNVFVDTHDLRFPWVSFFTKKRVRAGTELTWDYSYEVGSVEGRVLLCNCGSLKCTGRLL